MGGCSGRQADGGRTGEAGCCAADVEGLDRCSRSGRSSGSGGRRPRSAVGGAAVRIGACMQSAVACTGKELETYVKRAGCVAFLPGPWLCCGCAVRSSGSSCSGRFDCTCVVGGVRSKRPMAADTASARRAQRGNRRTGTSGCRFDAVPRCAAFVALVALPESATHVGCSARCRLAWN